MEKKERYLHLLMLACAVIAIYARSVFNGFTYDDWYYFVGNQTYKQLDFIRIFTTLPNGIEYQPVKDLTVLLDALLWGENPGGLHFTNMILFMFASFAVYFLSGELAALITRDRDPAPYRYLPLLSALLFVAHPINGEAVNFIGARNAVMGGTFFFLSVACYCRYIVKEERGGREYLWALGLFLLALLCKATVVILPVLLLFLHLLFGRRQQRPELVRLVPFFGLAAGFFYLFTRIGLSAKIINQSAVNANFNPELLLGRFAVAAQIPFFYIQKLFVPVGFAARYMTGFSRSFFSPVAMAAVVTLLLLAGATLMQRKRNPEFALGFFWFMISLAPVLNFYGTYPVVADRYAFIPAVGLFFTIAVLFSRLAGGRQKHVYLSIAAIIVVVCAGLSFQRVGVWKDNKSLWQANIEAVPNEPDAYVALAAEYFKEGEYDRALEICSRAKKINPLEISYELALGRIYFMRGEYGKAIEVLQSGLALETRPNSNRARANFILGEVYSKAGNYEKALNHYVAALDNQQEDNRLAADVNKRIKALSAMQSDSLDVLKQRVASRPDDLEALGNIALQLDRFGSYDEALKYYSRMEQLGMKDWRLYYNIANASKKLKEFARAVEYYNKSLSLKPDNLDALNNLGLVLADRGDFRGAIAAFERAMAIRGDYSFAPFNLALTYEKMGDKQNARRYLNYVIARFPETKDLALAHIRKMDLLEPAKDK